jgi:hypothetical protein
MLVTIKRHDGTLETLIRNVGCQLNGLRIVAITFDNPHELMELANAPRIVNWLCSVAKQFTLARPIIQVTAAQNRQIVSENPPEEPRP